jgi:uncharacterized protein (TIGR00725 family)
MNELVFKGSLDWKRKQLITVSVIGGHDISDEVEILAQNIGKIIAKVGAILICGGLGGVMKAASRGCKQAGGMTIGLLPGKNKGDANPYIDVALPTTIGYARNACVAASADVIVALPGSHGTNSEICYGLVYGRPVIDMGGWKIKGMIRPKGLKDFERVLRKCIQQARR